MSSSLLNKFRHRWLLALGIAPLAAACEGYTFVECENDNIDSTGLATCEDGSLHRPAAFTCDKMGPATGSDACMSDEHCTGAGDGSLPMYCACGPDGGICQSSFCRSDADCEAPYACAEIYNSTMLACQTADDECMADADCADDGWCAYDGARRVCEYPCEVDCPIEGRPFLVADDNRRAPAVSRRDWCEPTSVISVAGPTPTTTERAALGRHWADVGLMEHASIAAFARLALQLLGLGAPPDLIERATRAMADERRHASFAFRLASDYLGEPIGPGRIDIDGALAGSDMATLVRLAIREGCVGETSAAWSMHDGALACSDPALREALLGIAEDELGHAELAWATVAWALTAFEPAVRSVIEEELALLRSRAASPKAAAEPIARFGVKSDARFRELRERAIHKIVIPLLEEALAEADSLGDASPLMA